MTKINWFKLCAWLSFSLALAGCGDNRDNRSAWDKMSEKEKNRAITEEYLRQRHPGASDEQIRKGADRVVKEVYKNK